jgi:hypothetical protein
MKKLNANRTRNSSRRMRFPAAKAVLLAGACLSLGGLAPMGSVSKGATVIVVPKVQIAVPKAQIVLSQPQIAVPQPHTDQGTNRLGMHRYDIGNEWGGLDTVFGAFAQNCAKAWTSRLVWDGSRWLDRGAYSQTYSKAILTSGHLLSKVKFLEKTVPVLRFSASVENTNGNRRSDYCLSSDGYNVSAVAGAHCTSNLSFTWSKTYSTTFLDASATWWVGPVPVTISGSLSGGADIGFGFDLPPNGVNLSGYGSVYLSGTASAGFDIVVAEVGIEADFTLGRTTLKASLQITPTSMSGQTDLEFTAVKLRLYLFAELFGETGTADLLKYESDPWVYPLLRF